MPRVSDTFLKVGRGSDERNWVEVQYVIEFLREERRLGLDFDEYVLLIEVDAERDEFKWVTDAYGARFNSIADFAELDDQMVIVHQGLVSPSPTPIERKWENSWTPGWSTSWTEGHRIRTRGASDEYGEEEYQALISIQPARVLPVMHFTDSVSVDLDPDRR